MDQRFEQTAFYPADILLPQTAEMKKWDCRKERGSPIF